MATLLFPMTFLWLPAHFWYAGMFGFAHLKSPVAFRISTRSFARILASFGDW